MSVGDSSTWLKTPARSTSETSTTTTSRFPSTVAGRQAFLWFLWLPASSLGGPIAPVDSLACTLVRNAQADPDRRAWHRAQVVPTLCQ
jgi:hypothetical protein